MKNRFLMKESNPSDRIRYNGAAVIVKGEDLFFVGLVIVNGGF